MRVLGANHGGNAGHGVFTDRPGQLTNDFFVNLLDMGTVWKVVDDSGDEEFRRHRPQDAARRSGAATRTDLVFGSNCQLRAVAEVYAEEPAAREVRRGLRQGLDQGHERRPLRPALREVPQVGACLPGGPCVPLRPPETTPGSDAGGLFLCGCGKGGGKRTSSLTVMLNSFQHPFCQPDRRRRWSDGPRTKFRVTKCNTARRFKIGWEATISSLPRTPSRGPSLLQAVPPPS